METPFTLSPGGIAFPSFQCFWPWWTVTAVSYLGRNVEIVHVSKGTIQWIVCETEERAAEAFAQIVREMGGRL